MKNLLRNRKSQNANRTFAFTLIELLTVVAIIAILASMVIGVSGYASRKADISKARADMEKIKNGLEEYRITYGKYPEGDSNILIQALWIDPQKDPRVNRPFLVMKGWDNPDTAYTIEDPWTHPYCYYDGLNANAQHNKSRFGYDLWSLGPDGLDESEDDINNWTADQ